MNNSHIIRDLKYHKSRSRGHCPWVECRHRNTPCLLFYFHPRLTKRQVCSLILIPQKLTFTICILNSTIVRYLKVPIHWSGQCDASLKLNSLARSSLAHFKTHHSSWIKIKCMHLPRSNLYTWWIKITHCMHTNVLSMDVAPFTRHVHLVEHPNCIVISRAGLEGGRLRSGALPKSIDKWIRFGAVFFCPRQVSKISASVTPIACITR